MNKLYLYSSLIILALLSNIGYGTPIPEADAKGGVLILSSYNPDIKRMSSFISDFEGSLVSESSDYEIYIEDMSFKGVDESRNWRQSIEKTLTKYRNKNLKAILLLGQEVWAAYISLDRHDTQIPFFGCIASENGVEITDSTLTTYPENVNFITLSDSIGRAGGALNRYDIKQNIQLIKSIYQNIQHIAFISDNTYGGIAMQSLFIAEMNLEPNIDYILLDARDGIEAIESRISNLPLNSAVIIGTWRTGNMGQYQMYSSLEKIISLTNEPVFTISGVGLGGLAMGGYMPIYDNKAKQIAKQIADYYKGDSTAIHFIDPENEYRFDNSKLKAYGIKSYQLPKNSIVIDMVEAQLTTYKQYLYIGSIVLFVLVVAFVFITFLYLKNKKLKDNLKIRESELITAKIKAEESDVLKSAFLANMSHEIRTPLNAIMGFSTIICEEETSTEDRVEYGQIIKSNSEMLLTLINDILDISRLESTKMSFVNEQTDIIALLREVIYTTNHKNTAGIEIITETDLSSLIIFIDRKRLAQVLINLMTNAYKFTKKGSITISLSATDNECTFAVTDTGIGIPPQSQEKVFDRFEKMNNFAQGTGLGLAICRQIVIKFGGKIYVDPTYTTGAKFVFTIPR